MSDLSRKKYFKNIAHAEGISFLLLLGIAMPLKYAADMPLAVKYVGWGHGILFVWYMAIIVTYGADKQWSLLTKAKAVLAGLLPLGTFWFTKNNL